MWAHANFFMQKRILAGVSFTLTMALLASTTYAITSYNNSDSESEQTANSEKTTPDVAGASTLDDNTNDDVETEQEQETSSVEVTVPHSESTSNSSSSSTHIRIESSVKVSGGSASVSGEGDEEYYTEEGSEESNDSNVRIRVRNRSESELNGDDVGSEDTELKLDVRDSTSAD